MTLANRITLLRALLSAAMFVFIIMPGFGAKLTALILFTIAAITDWLDGKIARSTNTVTAFGAIADPFIDKILVAAALIAFASIRALNVPLWGVFLILARELMISSLRALAALNGQVLSAEKSGKFKTACQMIAVAVILIILNLHAISRSGPQELRVAAQQAFIYTAQWPYALTIAIVVITWMSAVSYLHNHWALLKKTWSKPQ
ncbi:MAG: CDP-diacylglycerol--glycerol-3-phosphate 3-phosphatidyltransferase [Elusimicrobia bacterium]|nr:CDP-diacylglycerol--glycerol-3-phosphate 3-phosphatidyltransferase [Elusimicrobiota bacterium]